MAPRREMPASRVQHRKLLELQKAGVYTTEDPQGKQNVFQEYQRFGLIPPEYETPAQLQDAMQSLIKSGIPKNQAMEALGVTAPIFNANGSINGRSIRDAMSPGMKELIDARAGEGTAERLAALERKGWRAGQEENRAMATSLGMAINAGHYDTSARGAPASNRAAGTESAVINQMQGRSAENPDRPLTPQNKLDLGVANTKIAGLYEAALEAEGMSARSGTAYPLNPYMSALLGSNPDTQYVSNQSLESLNRTFQDLAEQGYSEVGMYDYLKSGGMPTAEALATAGSEKRGVSTFATKPATEAPVTQVRPPTPKGPTVTTYQTPQAKVVLTPSQSLGRKAAAIANREPVKPPKPVIVSVKPAAKPKPSVKPARTAPAVSAAKPARTKPASASMQIRAMQNTAPDVLRIQPGMSLPSNSLIQGI